MKCGKNIDPDGLNGSTAVGGQICDLLHEAAAFQPEYEAPADMVPRAIERIGLAAGNERGKPFPSRPWAFSVGGSALAVLAGYGLAAAVVMAGRNNIAINHPNHTTNPAILEEASLLPSAVNVWQERTAPPEPVLAAAVETDRGHRIGKRRRSRTIAVPKDAAAIPNALVARRADATEIPVSLGRKNSAPQAQCGWQTEVVEQDSYVLVSPAILTEGSGDSEKAVPVLVQVPIDFDDKPTTDDSGAESGLSTDTR